MERRIRVGIFLYSVRYLIFSNLPKFLPFQLLSVEVESHKAHKAAVETQLQQVEKQFAASKEELQEARREATQSGAKNRETQQTRDILLELERERGRLAGTGR